MSLWSSFYHNNGRVIDKWKHYFPVYETHFRRYVNRPMTILEIGCGEGGSLQMWRDYFGPHAQIVGIDIMPHCAAFEEDQIAVRIGSQSDPSFLTSLVEEFGSPDIVVDDGSHVMSDVVATFGFLFPRTAPDGGLPRRGSAHGLLGPVRRRIAPSGHVHRAVQEPDRRVECRSYGGSATAHRVHA